MNNPPCPACGCKKADPQKGGFFRCTRCDGLYDSDPSEGGDHHDRNPAARLEREERQRTKRK